jgi:hypothetical protein
MDKAKIYVSELANSLTKITMNEFFKEVHSRCYSDQDLSFMEYFLELTNYEGEFKVPHSKLIDYGVMKKAADSSKVLQRLNALNLENEEDYLIADVKERSETSRGAKHTNVYHLTLEAFKKCLMRAQRRSNQPVDPVIYCDYYLLLEKIHKLFMNYQHQYSERLLAQKDDKLDRMSAKIDQQSADMQKQDAKIEQLLAFGNKLVGQNDKLQLTLDMTKEELGTSLDYLVEKSYRSTIDPTDASKVTHFAVLAPMGDTREGTTILVRGQTKRIDDVITKYVDSHDPVINITYNANAINLIVNAKERFDTTIRKYIVEYNKPIIQFNDQLKDEITAHNKRLTQLNKKKTPTTMVKRYFPSEKKELLRLSHIPITFKTTYIWYQPNPHFSYESIIGIITEMNDITQKTGIPRIPEGQRPSTLANVLSKPSPQKYLSTLA